MPARSGLPARRVCLRVRAESGIVLEMSPSPHPHRSRYGLRDTVERVRSGIEPVIVLTDANGERGGAGVVARSSCSTSAPSQSARRCDGGERHRRNAPSLSARRAARAEEVGACDDLYPPPDQLSLRDTGHAPAASARHRPRENHDLRIALAADHHAAHQLRGSATPDNSIAVATFTAPTSYSRSRA